MEATVPGLVPQRRRLNSQCQKGRFRNAAMVIRKWLGTGLNKRLINQEDEALMGKGIEEEGLGLAGRP